MNKSMLRVNIQIIPHAMPYMINKNDTNLTAHVNNIFHMTIVRYAQYATLCASSAILGLVLRTTSTKFQKQNMVTFIFSGS
jgi:hypothetical protein